MKRIDEIIDHETLNWLLEKENPSVRYFTLSRLLRAHEDEKTTLDAKNEIMISGIVPKILKKQNEVGYWGDPKKFYTDKYRGTVWQLMILAELGADGKNEQIKKACEFILQNSQEIVDHGFSYYRSEKSGGGLASGVIPCLTGNMVWSLIRLGYFQDQRVQAGIDWICKYQRSDDGTDHPPKGYPYDRYEMCWGRHSCHLGVVKCLKALSAIDPDKRNEKVKAKIDELSEYFLVHHIFKRSHDLTKISRKGWLNLGFPLMYQSDILEILGILIDLGFHDPRMQEAIEILHSKQNSNKRWKLENTFNSKMIENIEQKGKNSKWITQKATYILMNFLAQENGKDILAL